MINYNLGIAITGGTEGTKMMGDGTNLVHSGNVLDDYSVIYLNGSERHGGILFRCVSGLGPSGSNNNDVIGNLYFNNTLLPDGTCNGFVMVEGANNLDRYPGVYQARLCGSLTTSTEGVYTCRLMNSSMMYQNVRVGVYFSGRSMLSQF